MTMTYVEISRKHQERVNKFPMRFAFSKEQFKIAMESLGLTQYDTDKIISIAGGGFIKKTDVESYKAMWKEITAEKKKLIEADTDGTGFIAEMFQYELDNHEYGLTGEATEALEALGLTRQEIENSETLSNGFRIAKKRIWDYENSKEDYR